MADLTDDEFNRLHSAVDLLRNGAFYNFYNQTIDDITGAAGLIDRLAAEVKRRRMQMAEILSATGLALSAKFAFDARIIDLADVVSAASRDGREQP